MNTPRPPHPETLTATPNQLGQYAIVEVLRAGQTYLAQSASGRAVVLKMLDDDCLLRGRLHPDIRDRLARVRELAHTGVANFFGVERDADRDADRVFCVWEYINGIPFDEYASRFTSPEELVLAARELSLAVEAMHALGIVHGRMTEGNVIVDAMGRLRLTHISPLLYDNTEVDAAAVTAMIRRAAQGHGWTNLLALLSREQPKSLEQLRALLAAAPKPDAVGAHAASAAKDRAPRRRALALAALAAMAGAAVATGAIAIKMNRTTGRLVAPEARPEMLTPSSQPDDFDE